MHVSYVMFAFTICAFLFSSQFRPKIWAFSRLAFLPSIFPARCKGFWNWETSQSTIDIKKSMLSLRKFNGFFFCFVEHIRSGFVCMGVSFRRRYQSTAPLYSWRVVLFCSCRVSAFSPYEQQLTIFFKWKIVLHRFNLFAYVRFLNYIYR